MDCIIFNVGENEKRFLEELAKRYNITTDDVIREALQEYWFNDYYYFFKEVADIPQTDLVKESPSLVKDLVNAFCEDGTWLERQGVYTLTLAEAKQRAVDIIEAVSRKDTADTPQMDCGWK